MELMGEKIKKLMECNNISTKELAQKLKIKDSDLILKLSGKREFLANEAYEIANIFELTIQEFANIFFNSENPKENIKK